MRIAAFALFTVCTLLLAGCSGSSTDSSSSAGSSSSTTGTGSKTTTSSTSSVKTTGSGTTTSGSSTATGTTTTTTGTNSTTTGTGNSTAPGGKPTPVSVSCSLSGVTLSANGDAKCDSPTITSDTGGAFTTAKVTFTFGNVGPATTFNVLDSAGTVLGTASATTSPVVITLAAEKIPAPPSFTLTGQVKQPGATVIVGSGAASVTFDLS